MNDSANIFDTDKLKSLTGYNRPGDIERCLIKNGIRFFYGKNGPITTIDAINSALGLVAGSKPKTDQDFEFL